MAIEQVIKYEGDNTTFIWKHPCEDFNTGSQLIVHESQEAIFFVDGQAMELFGVGRHTLETQNLPFLRKIINIPTGGITPFHCEVYFVNKTEQMSIKWGTDSKVQYLDPTYNFPISIGANGEMALSVNDARKLLIKLVGTERALEQQQLVKFFRAFLMTKIKTYIAQTMKSSSINIFEIDEQLEVFSNTIKKRLDDDFLDYGINLKRFFVTGIVKPDGDLQYEKFKELHFRQYADIAEAKLQQKVEIIEQQTASQKMAIEAEGIAKKRQTEGYSYQQERGFDVAEKVAQNEGAGNFSSAGLGLGMIAGVGGVMSNAVSGIFNDSIEGMNQQSNAAVKRFCDNCGNEIMKGSVFCDNCGTSVMDDKSCIHCGFEFMRSGKFCPGCGSKRNT